MFKQKPFPLSILILAVLITFYSVGSRFSFYWRYPQQYDLLLHTFSGLWIALVLLWLAVAFGQFDSLKEYKVKSFLIAFVSAVFIGVVWELCENLLQLSSVFSPNYAFYTAIDIFTDALGGSIAYTYFVHRKRSVNKPVEIASPLFNQGEIKKID